MVFPAFVGQGLVPCRLCWLFGCLCVGYFVCTAAPTRFPFCFLVPCRLVALLFFCMATLCGCPFGCFVCTATPTRLPFWFLDNALPLGYEKRNSLCHIALPLFFRGSGWSCPIGFPSFRMRDVFLKKSGHRRTGTEAPWKTRYPVSNCPVFPFTSRPWKLFPFLPTRARR